MDWRDEFWGAVYDYRQHLWLLEMFMLFLFVLTAMSFALGHEKEESRVIAFVNLGLIGLTGGLAAVLYWYATKRKKEQP
ncbi:hypothetical protein [Halomicrobium salinisoli]|uniref:hypothetical protein n=1 Tax=Halomicrobium salinisoli TaxID=2878391 RepID=UPI001CEFFE90|nr:hypothetical protein [Halomicrobium salinisoli]